MFARTTFLLIAGACCVSIGSLAPAAEPAQTPNPRRQEIERLIEHLGSMYPKLRMIENPTDERLSEFVPEYVTQQTRVRESAAKLREIGVEAFSQLIEHFGDRRFSYPGSIVNTRPEPEEHPLAFSYCSISVGEHCREIVSERLCKFETWGGSREGPGPDRGHLDRWHQESAREWWEKNRHKPLWRLQADILQWAIDLDKTWQPKNEREAAVMRRVMEANQKKLDRLLTTQKPL